MIILLFINIIIHNIVVGGAREEEKERRRVKNDVLKKVIGEVGVFQHFRERKKDDYITVYYRERKKDVCEVLFHQHSSSHAGVVKTVRGEDER